MRIRAIEAADRAPLQDLLQRIENFTAEEVEVALELIDGAISDPATTGYLAKVLVVAEEQGERVAGYICWGPTPMTARTFDLYWIAVDASVRGKGLGRALILDLEEQLCAEGGGPMHTVSSASSTCFWLASAVECTATVLMPSSRQAR